MINVSHKFNVHEGGTKFYETALFEREDGGPSVLVKRFGRISDKKSGGQTKFENYSTSQEARQAARDIWKQKDKPKEYSNPVSLDHGIGTAVAGVSGTGKLRIHDRPSLIALVESHYGRSGGLELTIADALNMPDKYDPNADMVVETFAEEPIDRGEEYGSW